MTEQEYPNPDRVFVALRLACAGLFWALVYALVCPLAAAMRTDRAARAEADRNRAHASELGYDDNDPGVDVDCVPVPIAFDVETHIIQPGLHNPLMHPSAIAYSELLGQPGRVPTPGIPGNKCMECGWDAGPYHCSNCGAT